VSNHWSGGLGQFPITTYPMELTALERKMNLHHLFLPSRAIESKKGGHVRIRSVFAAVIALTFMALPAFGCKCVMSPPDIKTAQDLAHWYADRSDVIFEGTVEHVELKWALMEAKVGTLVPADLEQNPPVLQVTQERQK
jgi:hypothetical protein